MFWNFCGDLYEVLSNPPKPFLSSFAFVTWAKVFLIFSVLHYPLPPVPSWVPLMSLSDWKFWSVFHLFLIFCFSVDDLLWFQAGVLIFLSFFFLKNSHYLATISLNPSHLQTWYHLTVWPLCKSFFLFINICVCSFPFILTFWCLTVSGLQLV